MKSLIKKLLREAFDDESVYDREFRYLTSQTLLGHRIVGMINSESDGRWNKKIGFILDDNTAVYLQNIDFVDGKGYVVDAKTYIEYETDDDIISNSLKPWINSPEDLKKEIDKAIFPNKKELAKFYELLNNPYFGTIVFKISFRNVITKDTVIKKGKEIDIDRYKDYTFKYHDKEYKFDRSKVDNHDNKYVYISLSFDELNYEHPLSKTTIRLTITYTKNLLGKFEERPKTDIELSYPLSQDYIKINPQGLTPLINDILKQIKSK